MNKDGFDTVFVIRECAACEEFTRRVEEPSDIDNDVGTCEVCGGAQTSVGPDKCYCQE